jgi:hypothetical protein
VKFDSCALIVYVQEEYFGKSHNIFSKDVHRVLNEDKIVYKSKLIKKPAGVRSLLDFNNSKYKTRSQIIMQEYEKPVIS